MTDVLDFREMAESFANLAKLSRNLHLQFVAEGFTETQALSLTIAWMRETIRQARGGDE